MAFDPVGLSRALIGGIQRRRHGGKVDEGVVEGLRRRRLGD